jgi:hypothetical protein
MPCRLLQVSGATPTIVSYSAGGVVEIYNATITLAHFENKNVFFCLKKSL